MSTKQLAVVNRILIVILAVVLLSVEPPPLEPTLLESSFRQRSRVSSTPSVTFVVASAAQNKWIFQQYSSASFISQATASGLCRSAGKYLAAPLTSAEFQDAQAAMTLTDNEPAWMGACSEGSGTVYWKFCFGPDEALGRYFWTGGSSGRSMNGVAELWGSGQPHDRSDEIYGIFWGHQSGNEYVVDAKASSVSIRKYVCQSLSPTYTPDVTAWNYRKFTGVSISLTDANNGCRSQGGYLASWKNSDEFVRMKKQAYGDSFPTTGGDNPAWVGGSEHASPGTWKWLYSRPERVNDVIFVGGATSNDCRQPDCYWHPGEPNNSNEKYMVFYAGNNKRTWNDAGSTYRTSDYICEFPPGTETNAETQSRQAESATATLRESQTVADQRYRVFKHGSKIFQKEALFLCEKSGGWLATIPDRESQLLIQSLFANANIENAVLIGGNDVETDHDWVWIAGPKKGELFWRGQGASSGGKCHQANLNDCYWWANNPSGGAEHYMYILLDKRQNHFGYWNDAGDGGQSHYMCEYDVKHQITPSGKTLTESAPPLTRYIFYASTQPHPEKVIQFCRRQGGWLATIPDQASGNELRAALNQQKVVLDDNKRQVLIGGKYDSWQKKWFWVAGPHRRRYFSTGDRRQPDGGCINGYSGSLVCNWPHASIEDGCSSNGEVFGCSSKPWLSIGVDNSLLYNNVEAEDSNLQGFICEFGTKTLEVPYTRSETLDSRKRRYKFIMSYHETRTADQYGTDCEADGGWLAAAPNKEAMENIMAEIKSKSYGVRLSGDHEVVFGLRWNSSHEWHWGYGPLRGQRVASSDGTQCYQANDFCPWISPSQAVGGGTSQLIGLINNIDGEWNNHGIYPSNGDFGGYVCEYPDSMTLEPTNTFNQRYQLFNAGQRITAQEAYDGCRSKSGYLASFPSLSDYHQLLEQVPKSSLVKGAAYIGLQRRGSGRSAEWRWTQGAPYAQQAGVFFFGDDRGGECKMSGLVGSGRADSCMWSSTEPDGSSEDTQGYLLPHLTDKGDAMKITDQPDTRAIYYICEFPFLDTPTLSPHIGSTETIQRGVGGPSPTVNRRAAGSITAHPGPGGSITNQVGQTSTISLTAAQTLSKKEDSTRTLTFPATHSQSVITASDLSPSGGTLSRPTQTKSQGSMTESLPSLTPSWKTPSRSLHKAWLEIKNETREIQIAHLINPEEAKDVNLVISLNGGEEFDPSSIIISSSTSPSSSAASSSRGFLMQRSAGSPSSLLPRGTDMTKCLWLNSTQGALLRYGRGNVTAKALNLTTVKITFRHLTSRVVTDPSSSAPVTTLPPDPTSVNRSTDLRALSLKTAVQFTIIADCLQQRLGVDPVELNFVPPPVEEETDLQKVAKGTKTAVNSMGMIPGVAAAGARSGIILTLIDCRPEFYQRLGFSQNPIGVSLGDPKYGQYLSGTVFNHLIILGVAGFHFVAALIYRVLYPGTTIATATSRVRFPSLTIVPLLFLLEPTCMAAAVVTIYADSAGIKVIGVLGEILCFGYVIGMFIYIRKTWAGVFVPGENPGLLGPKKVTAIEDDDDPDKNEATHKTFCRRFLAWIGYFIDGGVHWKDEDPINNKGYCRRNRLLFMDYTGRWYWFLSLELLVAAICGMLDGIKLGTGNCDPIVICLIVVLALFFVACVITRPYNAPFLLFFSLVLTGMQLAAAVLMGISMFSGNEDLQEWAEWLTVIAFYVIVGRTFFDMAPKLKQIIQSWLRACFKKKDKENNNVDLTRQLLEVVQTDANDVQNRLQQQDAAVEGEQEEAAVAFPEYEFGDAGGAIEMNELGERVGGNEVAEEEEDAAHVLDLDQYADDDEIWAARNEEVKGEQQHGAVKQDEKIGSGDDELDRLLDGVEEHHQHQQQRDNAKNSSGGDVVVDEQRAHQLREKFLSNFDSTASTKAAGAEETNRKKAPTTATDGAGAAAKSLLDDDDLDALLDNLENTTDSSAPPRLGRSSDAGIEGQDQEGELSMLADDKQAALQRRATFANTLNGGKKGVAPVAGAAAVGVGEAQEKSVGASSHHVQKQRERDAMDLLLDDLEGLDLDALDDNQEEGEEADHHQEDHEGLEEGSGHIAEEEEEDDDDILFAPLSLTTGSGSSSNPPADDRVANDDSVSLLIPEPDEKEDQDDDEIPLPPATPNQQVADEEMLALL